MPRDRKGAQLALEVEPQLLERLRARAAADGRPLAALVRRWLEAGLAGALEQQAGPAGPDLADLAERVGWLEAELAQLRRSASPERVRPAPRTGEPVEPLQVPLGVGTLEIIGAGHLHPPAPAAASPERVSLQAQPGEPLPLPERRLTPAEAAGLLTTPEVGKALGLSSDSALTNWIAREASKRGGSAVGGIYRGHRLRGKGLLPGGQKPGWLWEPV
jgi:plasmid stability protein